MARETRALAPGDQPTPPAPVWRRLRDLASELGGDWRPVRGGGPDPELPADPTALGAAEIVEGDGAFRTHDVGAPARSRFAYALDGIEYTRVAGYVGTVPVVHGYVAAVVRRRTDRAFATWGVIEQEVLAFPHRFLPPDRFLELGFGPDVLEDSSVESDEHHPIRLAEEARAAVKRRRARIEAELARRWADAAPADGWLLVDGRLAIEPALLGSGRAIGLVKSHRTQFLDPTAMAEVLAMDGGRRSPVFKPVRPEVGEVYSWYLRLRPPTGRDLYWALARVEGRAGPDTVELADEVSRWLLHETAPLSLPDPRWDVLLYPIRDCETYLRARMPTLGVD